MLGQPPPVCPADRNTVRTPAKAHGAFFDEQEIVGIRRVDNGAGKQVAKVVLLVLPVEIGDVKNRFEPRGAELVSPQVGSAC